MNLNPVTILDPVGSPTALVLDSPHSGRVYSQDFKFVCPLPLLRQTEDGYVDELIAGATYIGAAIVIAEFPRSYIDVNRAENDIDPAVIADTWPEVLVPSDRTLLGLGLVRRLCRSGVPLYKTPLSVEEIQKRIHSCYRPYHAQLKKILDERREQFGFSYLINCHSMPDRGSSDKRFSSRPDFVLGDRHGSSCDPHFTHFASEVLRDMGYNVAINDPYKGVEIVRRYGLPRAGQYALQLEINRRLYIHEQSLDKTAGFPRLQRDLMKFFKCITDHIMANGADSDRLAAE